MAYSYIPMLLHTPLPPIEHQSNEISRIYLVTRILVLAGPFWNLGHLYITMLSAKKARQRALIVSGGDRILSDIEKLLIFTIVKMRFGCLRSEVKYQPKVDQCSLGAHSVPKDGAVYWWETACSVFKYCVT